MATTQKHKEKYKQYSDQAGEPEAHAPKAAIVEAAEAVTEPITRKAEKRAGKAHVKSEEVGALLDMTFMGAFHMVAMATQHTHWLKDQDQVRIATEPLRKMIESLPPKTVKAIEGKVLPVSFVIGMGMLAIPDVAYEIHLRRTEAKGKGMEQPARERTGGIHPTLQSPSSQGVGTSAGNGRANTEGQSGMPSVAADPAILGLD